MQDKRTATLLVEKVQDRDSGLRTITTLFLVGFSILLTLKVFLAMVLDLYSDEAFYWLESNFPALAYSDLPFMTAALIGLGSSLAPGSTLAVRAVFLVLGSSIPLLLLWIAKPITGTRQAWEATLLCLCLPLAAFLGLLAVPDVPLIFLGLLSIGFFERAIRLKLSRYWIATGVVAALGLCTHYRFALYPSAAFLFLACSRPHYYLWKSPKLWFAVLIMLLGLIPIVSFNLGNQLASATFYFVDRHPWEFQPQGLLHLFKQAALVTPPLYLLFAFTLWHMLKRGLSGDYQAGLLASFATVNLAVYLLLAPWTDSTSTSIHWPLSGYFPILVYVPLMLRQFNQWLLIRFQVSQAKKIGLSIPVLGFIGSLVALLVIGSQGFQNQLQALVGRGVLSNKMAGWQEFSQYTRELIAREFSDDLPVVITDNYYTSAQVQFGELASTNYSTDNAKAVRDGRLEQFILWQRDESAIENSSGLPALFISEDSTLTVPDKMAVLASFCRNVENLNFIDQLFLFDGDKRFSFYTASKISDAESNSALSKQRCPYPSQAWIDQPIDKQLVSGTFAIRGWAFNEDIGIRSLDLLLDNTFFDRFNYGLNRPDVVDAMDIDSDPNRPAVGFEYALDTTKLANGRTTISIEITNNAGEKQRYGARDIIINN